MSTDRHAHKIAHGVGSTIKWSIRILVLIVLIAIVAAIIGIGNAVKKSEQSSQQVTPAKFSQVHNGMTPSELQGLLGKPQRTDTSEIAGFGSLNCWIYGIFAQSGTYAFCFANGALTYKARYG